MAIFNLQFQQSDSQKVVIMAMTVIVVAALVERYSGKVKETATVPDIFIGAFIGTLILLLLSYILPEFAVGLAVIAAVTMIVSKGAPFWDAINSIFKHPANSPQPVKGTNGK